MTMFALWPWILIPDPSLETPRLLERLPVREDVPSSSMAAVRKRYQDLADVFCLIAVTVTFKLTCLPALDTGFSRAVLA
jgi:hypothetical protein